MNFNINTQNDKINLFWFKLPDGSSNYGDELNPFIIKELTGMEIRYIPYLSKWYKVIFKYLLSLIRKKEPLNFKDVFWSIFAKKILISIGSTINLYDRKGVVVWGAGIIHKDWKIRNATFCAVRGYETIKSIKNFNLNPPKAIGDPALLLPLIITPKEKKYKIGITPHYIHYEEFITYNAVDKDSLIIDMKENVCEVTEKITSCEYVLSTSLHGLIIAHAYNIPALWIELKCKNRLYGDNVKFKDYFSSTGIVPYEPFILKSLDIMYITELMNENSTKVLIQKNISDIQKDLLKSAPFYLKEKYKKML